MDSHREKSEELTAGASVLIRAHLDSPYLLEALESIATQSTSFPVEILLALDRATPHLMDQIEAFRGRFPDSRLRLFEHSSTGVASRLNALASHASYDFLCILDSDDRMLSSRIETQIKYLTANPNCAVVGSSIAIIDEHGKKVGEKGFLTSTESIQAHKYSRLPVAHPSVTIRKNALQNVGGYRDFYFPSEDYDLWLRLLERYQIVNLNEILTEYRIHESQATSMKFFRNYSAALAAKTSSRNRSSGKFEVNDSFETPQKWARRSTKLIEILQLTLKAYLWHQAKREVTSKHYLRATLIAMTFFVIFPLSGKREILTKFRNSAVYN